MVDFDHLNGENQEPKEIKKISTKDYNREMARLQMELVKMHEWIRREKKKVVVIFEGRDAAGKGGTIKRITQMLNPRVARVVALGTPNDREKTQWWFQRYVAQLPAGGEMVLFDRSWYNRAIVEPVMGFCTQEQYEEFLRTCPEFERMLIRSGITLIKYWFSVSDEEQERRFQARNTDPARRWKLSEMDLESRKRWVDFSKAKDRMFAVTDTKHAPWYVVEADIKKHARLNCIAHLLSMIPYEDHVEPPLPFPPLPDTSVYVRPPMSDQTFVPEVYPGKVLAEKAAKQAAKQAEKETDD
ncbi:MAG: polyphosphate kinase 2 [Anaerolineales bacterium]